MVSIYFLGFCKLYLYCSSQLPSIGNNKDFQEQIENFRTQVTQPKTKTFCFFRIYLEIRESVSCFYLILAVIWMYYHNKDSAWTYSSLSLVTKQNKIPEYRGHTLRNPQEPLVAPTGLSGCVWTTQGPFGHIKATRRLWGPLQVSMNMYLSISEPGFVLQITQPPKIAQNWFCIQNLHINLSCHKKKTI